MYLLPVKTIIQKFFKKAFEASFIRAIWSVMGQRAAVLQKYNDLTRFP